MKKRMGRLILFFLLTLGVFPAIMAAPKVQEAMELRYAYGGPNRGSFAEMNQWFCDEIARRTDGKVTITIHWGGTLLKMPDAMSGIKKGVADMGAVMGGPTVSQNPHFSTLSMVGAGKNTWAIMWATYQMHQNNKEIKAEFDRHNVVPTHGYFPGTPILLLKKPVNSLSDLKGLRIRGGTPDEAMAWSKLGVETVTLTLPEVYDAIDKGVIDGTLFTPMWASALKLGDVAKYWYQFSDNLIGGDVTTVINKDVWNKFTWETRNIIDKLVLEYNDKYTKAVLELEEKMIEGAVANMGVTYQEIDPEVDRAYSKAIDAAHETWFKKWDKRGNNTRGVWDQYQDYVRQYEREFYEKGYPWDR